MKRWYWGMGMVDEPEMTEVAAANIDALSRSGHVLPLAVRTYPVRCWCGDCVDQLGDLLEVMVTWDNARRTQPWGN